MRVARVSCVTRQASAPAAPRERIRRREEPVPCLTRVPVDLVDRPRRRRRLGETQGRCALASVLPSRLSAAASAFLRSDERVERPLIQGVERRVGLRGRTGGSPSHHRSIRTILHRFTGFRGSKVLRVPEVQTFLNPSGPSNLRTSRTSEPPEPPGTPWNLWNPGISGTLCHHRCWSDWMKCTDGHYDLVVLGGGPAGAAGAITAAAEGHRVVVVERAPHLGGRRVSTPAPCRARRCARRR